MEFNNFNILPIIFFLYLNKKMTLMVGTSYITLPAMLHISKYMWLMFYFFLNIYPCFTF